MKFEYATFALLQILVVKYCFGQYWSPNNSTGPVCVDPVTMQNFRWETNVTSNISCINPSTIDEMQNLLKYAYDNVTNASVRPIGKSVAWSAIGMMDTKNSDTSLPQTVYFVNQSEYRSNCTVNESSKTITCEAGARVMDVNEHLHDHNLSLVTFGNPLLANFIASCNACNHNRGSRKNPVGVMASTITAFDILLPNGTYITDVTNESYPDLFNAGRISMGLLGIITKFTAQGQNIQYVTQNRTNSDDNFTSTPDGFNKMYNYVTDELDVWLDEVDYIYGGYNLFRHEFSFRTYYIVTGPNDPLWSNTTCWKNASELNSAPCTDVSYKVVTTPPMRVYGGSTNHEAEFFVQGKYYREIYLAALYWVISQQTCNPDMYNVTKESWIERGRGGDGEIKVNTRWIGADDIWLSPGYSEQGVNGDAVVHIGIYLASDYVRIDDYIWDFWVDGFYKAISHRMNYLRDANNDEDNTFIRIHCGKASQRNYCEIKDDYAKMQDFRDLRDEYDPNGTMVNKFARDKFQIGDTCQDKCCCTEYTCNKTDGLDYNYTCGLLPNIPILEFLNSTEITPQNEDGDDDASNLSGGVIVYLMAAVLILFLRF